MTLAVVACHKSNRFGTTPRPAQSHSPNLETQARGLAMADVFAYPRHSGAVGLAAQLVDGGHG